ncbi:MAG: hypothetical protein K0R92_2336 [Lachnospiraceae bacterium]|jgi:uncharacterized beta-barrel protein YwiB (DUF1934 family)|nr:hypothetical protein [Lachnospiraceae bacterium]
MKKDVLMSISGLQYEIDKEEAVEVVSNGEYYNKNGKHYILYQEIAEDVDDISNCTLKISEKQIDIIKKGASNVHMTFSENENSMTIYQTPFGELQVGIHTTHLSVLEEEDKISVNIKYALDVNYAHVSDCEITIKITSKKQSSYN